MQSVIVIRQIVLMAAIAAILEVKRLQRLPMVILYGIGLANTIA